MHLQRLFEIVYLLLYRKKVTAKELAERFKYQHAPFIVILIP